MRTLPNIDTNRPLGALEDGVPVWEAMGSLSKVDLVTSEMFSMDLAEGTFSQTGISPWLSLHHDQESWSLHPLLLVELLLPRFLWLLRCDMLPHP